MIFANVNHFFFIIYFMYVNRRAFMAMHHSSILQPCPLNTEASMGHHHPSPSHPSTAYQTDLKRTAVAAVVDTATKSAQMSSGHWAPQTTVHRSSTCKCSARKRTCESTSNSIGRSTE